MPSTTMPPTHPPHRSPRARRLRTALLVAVTALASVAALVAPPLTRTADAAVGSAIAHRWSATATASAATSVTVARASTVAKGDVLLARVAVRNNVSASVSATGWTVVGATASSSLIKSVVLVRVAGSSEPSRYTFRSSLRVPLLAAVSAFRGVSTTSPVDRLVGQVNGSATTFATPVVDTSVGNEVAVWFASQVTGSSSCSSATITKPKWFTTVKSACATGGVGLSGTTAVRQLGAPAARGGWVGTSAVNGTNITQVVTLRPKAGVQAASRYMTTSVDVGQLWKGRTSAGTRITSLADSTLHEPSGLAASWTYKGILYAHSEASVHGMVAVRASTAEVIGSFQVMIPNQFDWEDIAVGPCASGSCIYAGDIGSAKTGSKAPSTFAVYVVAEPKLGSGQVSGQLKGSRYRFKYPDGSHNAEALMVHPTSGRVYIITKEKSGRSGVYTFPEAKLSRNSRTKVTTLKKLATLSVPRWTGSAANTSAATWFAQVTAASIHPAGDRFILRTPYRVYEYRASKDKAFSTAFKAKPVTLTAPSSESQGEAIEYARDGSAYYTLGERDNPPYTLKRVDRR